MVVIAEATGASARLATWFRVASSGAVVSFKGPTGSARTVVNTAAASVGRPVPGEIVATGSAATTVISGASASPIVRVPVVKRSAIRVVPVVVINRVVVVPIEAPATPAPAVARR